MTIRVAWADEAQSLIHIVFEPDWTLDEFYQLHELTINMLDIVAHSVYCL